MAPTFLSNTEVNSARCSICRSYLSVGPIWIRSNHQPACGRCSLPSNDAKYRAIFFEKVARYMIFPCRNDVHGCDAKLSWGSVQSHEQNCQFAPMKCPAFQCNDDIRIENINEHFTKKHTELIMKSNEFQMNFKYFEENARMNKLFTWKNKEYLVQISYFNDAYFINIASFEKLIIELTYDLTISDHEGSGEFHIRKNQITNYQEKKHDYSKMKMIDYKAFSKLLTDNVFCTFTISGKKTSCEDPLNEKLLADLECPVCFDYMCPPIYMCDKGHSVCAKCKNKINQCPSCRITLADSRNYTLEKISEHVSYPCKYLTDGCNFYGKIHELPSHEISCLSSNGNSNKDSCYCFVQPCSWVGTTKHFTEHIKEKHDAQLLPLGSPVAFGWSRADQAASFACYDGHIFRLRFNFGNTVGFRLQVLNVSDSKKHDYRFYVSFISNGSEILSLSKKCGQDSLDINKCLLRPFLKRNKFSVEINITES